MRTGVQGLNAAAGPVSDLLVRKGYTAGYDRRLRHPAWVRPPSFCEIRRTLTGHQTAEHLTLASLGKSALAEPVSADEAGDRSRSQFKEDEAIPALFRARLKDYFRSGYDRGHMVPAADCKSSQVRGPVYRAQRVC
jgi:endonuclease G